MILVRLFSMKLSSNHILTATAYPMALCVTLMYWSKMHDPNKIYEQIWDNYINLAVHLLPVDALLLHFNLA